jgi:hypothetical protein
VIALLKTPFENLELPDQSCDLPDYQVRADPSSLGRKELKPEARIPNKLRPRIVTVEERTSS